MTTEAVALRGAVAAPAPRDIAGWQRAAVLHGPVDLWVAALSDDGRLLGAARLPMPRWEWRNGLVQEFGSVPVTVMTAGTIGGAWLIAVSGRDWVPVSELDLAITAREVRRGDRIEMTSVTMRHLRHQPR